MTTRAGLSLSRAVWDAVVTAIIIAMLVAIIVTVLATTNDTSAVPVPDGPQPPIGTRSAQV